MRTAGTFAPALRGLDIGGAELEEVPPLPGILRARDLPGHRVDNSEFPITDETVFVTSAAFNSSPIIDFTG